MGVLDQHLHANHATISSTQFSPVPLIFSPKEITEKALTFYIYQNAYFSDRNVILMEGVLTIGVVLVKELLDRSTWIFASSSPHSSAGASVNRPKWNSCAVLPPASSRWRRRSVAADPAVSPGWWNMKSSVAAFSLYLLFDSHNPFVSYRLCSSYNPFVSYRLFFCLITLCCFRFFSCSSYLDHLTFFRV